MALARLLSRAPFLMLKETQWSVILLEIPLPMSCGEMRFLALTLWSSTSRTGARRDGIAVSEKWLDVMVCFFVNSAKDFQSPTIQSR